MAQDKAVQAERVRDLRNQLGGIGNSEMPEIQFQVISPGRAPVTIYAVEDGRPVTIPEYYLPAVMTKTLDDGRYMFVADAKDAPEYKMGEVKCFLHPDSPMREIVEAVGLGAIKCQKSTLASDYAGTIHGEHRHRQEWGAVAKHLKEEKEAKAIARQDEQLQATLSIARGGAAVAVKGECDVCGKGGFKNVSAHKRGAHKEG